jgi:hypothetical protein
MVFSSYFDTYYQVNLQAKQVLSLHFVGVLSGDIVIILNLFYKGISQLCSPFY